MKIKSIIITLISFIALVFLWNYIDSFTSVADEAILAFIIMLFIIFPMFAYGVVLMLKDFNTIMIKKRKSIFYHIYSLMKVTVGIMSISLGIFIIYYELIETNIFFENWFNTIFHSLIIYTLISIGLKIIISIIKNYKSKKMYNKS